MTSEVFLGRQAIVDADNGIFGYELLYRGGPDPRTALDDPDEVTRSVMERVLLQWGMEHIVGDRFGMMNASASLVVNGLHEAMPPEGMIIEVREPEPFDQRTVDALRNARLSGYHFALDNVSRLGDMERSELLPLASLVKIEPSSVHHGEIDRLLGVARERSPGVLLVAEKVESQDEFNRCVEHGFDLFQGYHVSEPEVLHRPARNATRRSAIALHIALKSGAEIDVGLVRAIVESDPSLTFRLLTAVNANAFGLDRRVTTLDQAMELLGIGKLRCLADLLASSTDAVDDDDENHAEEITRGAARANMMESLLDEPELVRFGVTAALLSVVDRLYGAPLGELLDELPMSDVTIQAVLHGVGPVGRALDIVRACERSDRVAIEQLAPGRADELIDVYQRTRASARRASSTGSSVDDSTRSETHEPA